MALGDLRTTTENAHKEERFRLMEEIATERRGHLQALGRANELEKKVQILESTLAQREKELQEKERSEEMKVWEHRVEQTRTSVAQNVNNCS